MPENNPFVARCIAGEWKNPCVSPDTRALNVRTSEERAEHMELMRQWRVCEEESVATFKRDVLAECNFTNEPDAEKLFWIATAISSIGCVGIYDYIANVAVARGLYEKIPWR